MGGGAKVGGRTTIHILDIWCRCFRLESSVIMAQQTLHLSVCSRIESPLKHSVNGLACKNMLCLFLNSGLLSLARKFSAIILHIK